MEETKRSNFLNGTLVSPILIGINILVFVLMVAMGVHFMNPEGQQLIDWGANFGPMTTDGEWWRLLTACFIHIGVVHLLMNMYALFYIGTILEPIIGKGKFLWAYIFTGLMGSVASTWWNDAIISAGASGAVFGMYGVFLALLTSNVLHESARKSFMTSILIFVGYNLVYGFSPDSGIDNAGHIGGLVSGLFVGFAMIPSLKGKTKKGSIATILVLLLLTTVSLFLLRNSKTDLAAYEKTMQQFSKDEEMALRVYKLPQGTSDQVLAAEIRDSGLYYWNKSMSLLNDVDSMNLPQKVKD